MLAGEVTVSVLDSVVAPVTASLIVCAAAKVFAALNEA